MYNEYHLMRNRLSIYPITLQEYTICTLPNHKAVLYVAIDYYKF